MSVKALLLAGVLLLTGIAMLGIYIAVLLQGVSLYTAQVESHTLYIELQLEEIEKRIK